MLYPLVIDRDVRAMIVQLVITAFADPISYSTLLGLADKHARGETIEGLNNDKTISLPTCYRVTFTVEEHHPGKLFRHLSLSIIDGRKGAGPAPHAVDMVITEFGFQGGLANCRLDSETLPGGNFAVGVIQPVDGNWHIT